MEKINMLFIIISGACEDEIYKIAAEIKNASNEKINPVFLWFTKQYRRNPDERYAGEDYLRDVMAKYPMDPSHVEAYYRAFRYDSIDLVDVNRLLAVLKPSSLPLEKVIRQSIPYLHAFKNYLIERKIDCIFLFAGKSQSHLTLNAVASKLGIPLLYVNASLFMGKITHIWDSVQGYTDDLRNVGLKKLTPKQKEEVDEFIEAETRSRELTYPVSMFKKPLPRKVKSFFRILYHRLFSGPGLYGDKGLLELTREEIEKRIRGYLSNRFYDHTPPERMGQYILLPYQAYTDFQLPLIWPEYSHMEFFVDICAKSLPGGYKLVVKEHPHYKGVTSLSELERVSKKENVVLVPIDTDVHELIRYCSAVATVSSTVGVQALMHHKPVVLMDSTVYDDWRIFYGDYGITFNVKDPVDLSDKLREAINATLDLERIDSFLYHVIMKLKRSELVCPVDYFNILKGENASILAGCVLKKLEEEGIYKSPK